MLIGELARRSGTTTKALRFYEDAGLMPEPARTHGGYRDYPVAALDRLTFIHEAQAAGFSLRQIREILDIRDSGQPPCEHVGALISQRLGELERRITELERTRHTLRDLARRTDDLDPAECSGYCSIIQNQL